MQNFPARARVSITTLDVTTAPWGALIVGRRLLTAVAYIQGRTKKIYYFFKSWRAKKTDFGVGILVPVDILC